MQNGVFIR